MIKVDPGMCLGCLSCSNVCPNQNIVLLQSADTRTVHWKKCKEECDLCVEFCPAKALALVAYDELVPESEISFELVACRVCGSRYATLPMLMKVEASLPAGMQEDASGLEWIRICSQCRRDIEAEKAAGQVMKERKRISP